MVLLDYDSWSKPLDFLSVAAAETYGITSEIIDRLGELQAELTAHNWKLNAFDVTTIWPRMLCDIYEQCLIRKNKDICEIYLNDVGIDIEQKELKRESVRNMSGFLTDLKLPYSGKRLAQLIDYASYEEEDEIEHIIKSLRRALRRPQLPEEVVEKARILYELAYKESKYYDITALN